MPYVFDMSLVGPISQIGRLQGFDDRISDLQRRADISGVFKDGSRLLAPDELPEGVVLERRTRLPDGFRTDGGLHVFSDAARQAVEALEPGRHQFFPLSLHWRNGERPENTWWGLNVTQKRDSVVQEGSAVRRRYRDDEPVRAGVRQDVLQMLDRKQIILDPARISDAHLWREERFTSELFCSDALRDAFKAQGLRVFRTFKAKAPPGALRPAPTRPGAR